MKKSTKTKRVTPGGRRKLLPAEQRSRQQVYILKKLEEGLCPRCGTERRDFNPVTGKPFRYGPHCRKKYNAEKKLQMRAVRARKAGKR